ncbi:hypothetical protein G6F23_013609 [Rhizopus arrhizus]|nr:hypothetical protein G6F23_013609 [Rhizopus arrhizus]
MGTLEYVQIAVATLVDVGLRQEATFRTRATDTETLQQGRVIKRVGGVQQRLGALQRGTQLADVPALDDRDAVLQHLAGAHAPQQFARGQVGAERVFAHLQFAGGIELARQQLPLRILAFIHAGLAQFAQHAVHAIAAGDDHALGGRGDPRGGEGAAPAGRGRLGRVADRGECLRRAVLQQ